MTYSLTLRLNEFFLGNGFPNTITNDKCNAYFKA